MGFKAIQKERGSVILPVIYYLYDAASKHFLKSCSAQHTLTSQKDNGMAVDKACLLGLKEFTLPERSSERFALKHKLHSLQKQKKVSFADDQ